MRDDPFPGVGRRDLERRIDDARLGRTDRTIARMRLLDGEYFADIGAEVGYDRRTVARRMDRIIEALK